MIRFIALNLMSLTVVLAANAQAPAPSKNQAPSLSRANASPKSGAADPNSADNSDVSSAKSGAASGFMDPFDYDQRGRRDPFIMPVPDRPVDQGSLRGPLLPLQKFDLAQLRLVGIIWDVKHPKAMIKDPTGQTHVVGTNTKVGPRNGYIAVIREGEMVIVETTEQEGKLVSSAQVVKIAR